MKITKVRYYGVNSNSRNVEGFSYLAKCSVVLDDVFILNEIKIFTGNDKNRYIIMPAKYPDNGSVNKKSNVEDIFHPVDSSFFNYMVGVVLEGYKKYEKDGSREYNP